MHTSASIFALGLVPSMISPAYAAGEVDLSRSALAFERNLGQAGEAFEFAARGSDYALGLSAHGASLVAGTARIDLTLVGARQDARGEGELAGRGRASYFLGRDPSQWVRGAPTFARVRYDEVWPGVDVLYHGCGRQLEYDFEVAPGADPCAIRLAFAGACVVRVAADGALELVTASGVLRQAPPLVFQDDCELAGSWRVGDDGTASFEVAAHDATRPLVIDPVIEWTALIGAGNDETARAVAVDALGQIVVVGQTDSPGFPTTGSAFDSKAAGRDAFLIVLDSSGYEHLYTAFFGGLGFDEAVSVALHPQNSRLAYVTGTTYSVDFPLAAPAGQAPFQANRLGTSDAFALKLDLDLDELVYSTYLGGTDVDDGLGIAVDSNGLACVVGSTLSGDFPVVNGPQPDAGGSVDGFATKLGPDGGTIQWSTYLGGTSSDQVTAVAIDSVDNVYYAGTQNFGDPGFRQVVVQHVHPGNVFGVQRVLGGSSSDEASGVAVDEYGIVYVTGTTASTDFPLDQPTQATPGGLEDAFVLKLQPLTLGTMFSTYFGGSGVDEGLGVAARGETVWIVGRTTSSDLITAQAISNYLGGFVDGFAARFATQSSPNPSVDVATYFPGGDREVLYGVALDGADAIVAGEIESEWEDPDILATTTFGSFAQADSTALVARIDLDSDIGVGTAQFGTTEDVATDGEVYEFYVYRSLGNSYPGGVAFEVLRNGVVLPEYSGLVFFQSDEQFARGSVNLSLVYLPLHDDFDVRLLLSGDGCAIGTPNLLHVVVGAAPPSGGGDGGGDDEPCPFEGIATGTGLEPGLDDLRGFRDRWLMPHAFGRELARAYYRSGPQVNRLLRAHPELVPAARVLTLLAIVFARWPLAFLLGVAALIAWRIPSLRAAFARIASRAALSNAGSSARILGPRWLTVRSTPASSTSTGL